MIFNKTEIEGVYVIDINKIADERGFFGRSWCQKEMEEQGLNGNVVQSNTSFNKFKGTLRGMHYQVNPYEETKLVRCIRGAIFDVIIDLRQDSPTFKRWFGIELTEDNHRMLYVPEKFAHGFITLKDNSEVTYLVTQFYKPSAEGGIRWDDPEIGIDWPIEAEVVSDRDTMHPNFKNIILP
ncbi:dTDP-4-dehydrorhamnose 3,5-epimerase [Sunxiuqinia sp. A32]|uniref:dTDP-4-dehydrorhamnose 3,5-epimerase n=1 Tax=Sunxiuqinia sp. A32 TaxID=3461496 RepID=UPI0040464CC3